MWQSRPIFISSTFADMQAERDYLRTHVFPELEERLRTRRRNLEWVDLRIGVATASLGEEHVRELHVLKVCLDEVHRCRPFLIVLLGDRYGWVPPEDRVKAAAEEAREGFSADVAGRSATDLEIEFGVLSNLEQQPRSFFYFREPLPYAQMSAEVAALYCEDYAVDAGKAERKERLAALKRRIRLQLPARIRSYEVGWDRERNRALGLEDFGRMVLDDLWSEFDAETNAAAAEADVPWQQAERNALEDFIDDRVRDFVGRESILGSLIALTSGAETGAGGMGACLTGDPGSGKSALFGALYRRLRERRVFLLAHAAGASPTAGSVDSMLRRFIGELATALGVDPALADNADQERVETTFARLFGQMAQRQRVVVLLDALDQFESTTRAQYLTWLPRIWPANARLVATAIPGKASQSLSERPGIELLRLPALDAAEASDIIAGVCRRYHRTFEREVVDALLAKHGAQGPAWGNPLWLMLAVEELNLLDADDFARAQRSYSGHPAVRLRELMCNTVAELPGDVSRLYEYTFARAEKLFGERLTSSFLGLLAVSRGGWRESDFRVLLPRASGESWDELKFAQLRRIFRGQLRERGALAQWDFNHAQMRTAVRARLGVDGVSQQSLHTIIADRLLSCPPDDPLHVSETMLHLLASEDYERGADYYGNPSLSDAEVQGATQVLASAVTTPASGTPEAAAGQICRLLEVSDPSTSARTAHRFIFNLDIAITHLDVRRVIFESTKATFERLLRVDPGNVDWQRDLAVSCERIGDVQLAQGDMAGALRSYRNSLAIFERLAIADPGNALWNRDLSVSYVRVGDVLADQGDLAGAVKSYRDSLAILERLARADPGDVRLQRDLSVSFKIGDVLVARGDLAGALKSYRDALAILERLARSDPGNVDWQRDLSLSYDNVGNVLMAQGDLAGAVKLYADSLAISQRMALSDPGNAGWQSDLSSSYNNVGDVRAAQGDLGGALKLYRDSLAIRERLARSDPGNAGWQRSLAASHIKVGDVQLAQGDLAGALKSCRDSLAIFDRLARSDPANADWQRNLSVAHDKVGNLQAAQGDLAGALKSFRDSLATFDRLAGSDRSNARWQRDLSVSHERIGQLQLAQGDVAGALKSFLDSVTIRGQLVRADPSDIGLQRDLSVSFNKIGEVLVAVGDLPGALKCCHDSVAITERLARSDPGNAGWQRDLAVSYERLGNVQKAQGDLAGALKSYRNTLAVTGRLALSDSGNAGWQRDLVVSFNRVGDVQLAQGDVAGAMKSYQDSLVIGEQLARSDPGNPGLREMAAAYSKLANMFAKSGDRTKALDAARRGQAVMSRLAALSPANDAWKRDLGWFNGVIAQLSQS